MKQRSAQLYQQLVNELEATREGVTSIRQQVEENFIICNQYRSLVLHEVAQFHF